MACPNEVADRSTSYQSKVSLLIVFFNTQEHAISLIYTDIPTFVFFILFSKDDSCHDDLARQATAIMLTAREKHRLSQVCLCMQDCSDYFDMFI